MSGEMPFGRLLAVLSWIGITFDAETIMSMHEQLQEIRQLPQTVDGPRAQS